jgi:hypothetical protein
MSKRSHDVPGNAVASAEAVQREVLRRYSVASRFEQAVGRRWDVDDLDIHSIRVRLDSSGSGEHLGIVSATKGGEHFVAFVSGNTLLDVIVNMVTKIENGTLQWKVDQWKQNNP